MSDFLAVVGVVALGLALIFLAYRLGYAAVAAIRRPAVRKAEQALDRAAILEDRLRRVTPKPYYGWGDNYDFSDHPRAAPAARVEHLEERLGALAELVKSNEIDKKKPGKKESK